jgi:hypothetical protein
MLDGAERVDVAAGEDQAGTVAAIARQTRIRRQGGCSALDEG